ncbi:hypothetical protein ACFSQQ_28610 [Mesorhizobium kowhaii]|uniref:hypothetical protein n=1 Tax=Mesorhizobium kowhaii TaxID=1300272 RepID=UPI0035E74FF5
MSDTAAGVKPLGRSINHWPAFFVILATGVLVVAVANENLAYAIGYAGAISLIAFFALRKARTLTSLVTGYIVYAAVLGTLVGVDVQSEIRHLREDISQGCLSRNTDVAQLAIEQQKPYCECYAGDMSINMTWWGAKNYVLLRTPAPNFRDNSELISMATEAANRCASQLKTR